MSDEHEIPTEAPQGEARDGEAEAGLFATIDAAELAKLRERAEGFEAAQADYLRALADMQNLRKRLQSDAEERGKRKVESLLRAVLSGIDELDRATANAGDSPLVQGVRMIREILNQAVIAEGVREIPAIGEVFNPKQHEAMTTLVDATKAPGTIVMELRVGYTWGDRVLRPSQVILAAAPPVNGAATAPNPTGESTAPPQSPSSNS